MELDLGAEWLGTVREQRLDRAEHRRPRAVVGVEAVLAAVFAHVLARHEVGVEVAAAESVDRLLGIADQAKQRRLRFATLRACGAGLVQAAEDRPLLRIGVLELRSEEHTSELQSLMRISSAVFCSKEQKKTYYQ